MENAFFFAFSSTVCYDRFKICRVGSCVYVWFSFKDFENEKTLEESYTFAKFFYESFYIKNKDGAELLLPATTLADNCYVSMFQSSKASSHASFEHVGYSQSLITSPS